MPAPTELVSPSVEFRDSYRGFVAEFAERNEKPIPFTLTFDSGDFAALVERLAACSRGIGLPDGFVAHSSYWLVRDRAEVVGVSNLRHALTPALRREGGHIGYSIRPSARGQRLGTEILRQTLLRAAGLGLPDVLITCAKANAASARVILRNGGELQSEAFVPERGEIVQSYRIRIAANALR